MGALAIDASEERQVYLSGWPTELDVVSLLEGYRAAQTLYRQVI